MSRILKRQLRRLNLSEDSLPENLEDWKQFLESIERTYQQYDEGRYLLERSIEVSSVEMRTEIEKNKMMSLQLAQANKLASLGTLASGIAHELNNPLAGIKGHSELLKMSGMRNDQEKSLDAMIRLSDRMAATIKHLLKLSRQATEFEKKPILVRTSIEDSLELFRRQFDTENISISVQCVNSAVVLATTDTLISVFQNLLANSRDAFSEQTHRSQKKIGINVEVTRGQVIIEYSDNAGGIPREALDRVFDPFYTTKEVGVGTGLGLSISKQVVDDLGGSMHVESEDGGARFLVIIPQFVKQDSIQSIGDSVTVSGVDTMPFARVPMRKYRTLIVDDEESICEFLARVLDGHFSVEETTSFDKGMELISANQFDLVITDIKMPGGSGYEIANHIRAKGDNTPIVFISGHVDNDQNEVLKPYEPYLLIEKPFPKPGEIVRLLTRYIEPSAA